MRVEVNAHQWAWDVRYAGPDGKFNTQDDIVTLNDMRVPVGVPVVLQLASSDVMHSFSLPNFRVKQDAVPGHDQPHLVPGQARPGEFDIACAQHCGVAPLQDEGPADRAVAGGLRGLGGRGRGQSARAPTTPPTRPPTGAGTGSGK